MRSASDGRNCTLSCPYDVVLVDEVGAATVPEVLLAVAKATETAVLFGDFLQLRAVTDKGVCAPRGPISVRKVSHQVHHRA
jgi:hypothetical protein